MRLWLGLLLLLALAAAAAFGWHWLAADPGYVLVRLRGTTLETTVTFALIALLLAWALLSLLWGLLRWPLRAWLHARQGRGRRRLGSGLMALIEGRPVQAERALAKAARWPALRVPALLGLAEAAHAQGADARVDEALAAVPPEAEAAAAILRARFLLERGDAEAAQALLAPLASAGRLPPNGWKLRVETALANGDATTAVAAWPTLARLPLLGERERAALETRVYTAALAQVEDATRLNALWQELPRTARRVPALIEAYARRAAGFGQVLAAMDAIESAQRRDWNDALALAWSELGPAELPARTRQAEDWLQRIPGSPALLLTLGRLCRDQALWGKAEQYLRRALALGAGAPAWEALGDCRAAQRDAASAQRCYANALRAARGEPVDDPTATSAVTETDTLPVIVEQRDANGVPRLPDPRY